MQKRLGKNFHILTIAKILIHSMLGLRQLHLRGKHHGDIKHENIFIHLNEGGVATCKVADLAGRGFHTKQYMAPEQKSHYSTWTDKVDVWALGVILHQFVTLLRDSEAPPNEPRGLVVARHTERSR